jgi:hypothetical protein
MFGDSITYGDSLVDHWVDAGVTEPVEVTEYDLDETTEPDSIYHFNRWASGEDRSYTLGPIENQVNDTAYYEADQAIISYNVTVDGVADSVWDTGTLDIHETYLMSPDNMFHIINTGNVPLDFGLSVLEVTDRVWTAGHTPEENRFVLRAKFNDETTPPSVFSMSRDWVKQSEVPDWATTGVSGIFGPGGRNVRPDEDYSSPESTENLWLQFTAPTWSPVFDTEITVTVRLAAKYYLP